MPGAGDEDGVRARVRQRDGLAAAGEDLGSGGAGGQDGAHPIVGLDGDDVPGPVRERACQQASAGAEIDDDVATHRQQPVQGRGRRARSQPVIVTGDAAERH
ncbi:MAG TPA: hypothetical protein VLM11_22430 [Streptosporangiaceae bacterium]|nr:hypothetical protein [Streptosporangiaceae bacterium]